LIDWSIDRLIYLDLGLRPYGPDAPRSQLKGSMCPIRSGY